MILLAGITSFTLLIVATVPSARANNSPPSWGGTQSWTNTYMQGDCHLGYKTATSGGGVTTVATPNCNGVEAIYAEIYTVAVGSSEGGISNTYSDYGQTSTIDSSGSCTRDCSTFYITNFNQGNTEVDISPNIFVLGSQSVDSEVTCTFFGCLGGAYTDTDVRMRFDVTQNGVCSPAGCTPSTNVFSNTFISDTLHCDNQNNVASCVKNTNYNNPYNPVFTLSLTPGQYYTTSLYFWAHVNISVFGVAAGAADSCFQQTSDCNIATQSPQASNCPAGSQPVNNNCLYVQWKNTDYTVHYPGFNIGSSPNSLSMNGGSSTTSTITISSTNGFAAPASLTATSDDPNLNFAFSPSSVTPPSGGSASSTLTISDPNTCDSGAHTITITGTATEPYIPFAMSFTTSATVSVSVTRTCDFNISASPNPQNILSGSSGSITITVGSVNGFTGSVYLTASVPPGLTCSSLSPSTVTLTSSTTSATSTFSCSGSAGTYAFSVTGNSAPLSHTVPITFNVQDFGIAANPTSVAFLTGSSGSSTVSVTSLGGFTGTVSLSSRVSPSALTCSLSSVSVTLGVAGTSTLACKGPVGTYSVNVTATNGSLSHSAIVTVAVQDFVLSASPTSLTVIAGQTGTSIITVGSVFGFSGNVNLVPTTSPLTGLTCAVDPTVVSGSGISTLSCSGSLGTYSVTVTGTSGTVSHAATVTVTVVGLYSFRDDFSYSSLSSMIAAGWTVCGTQSQVTLGGGVLSLTNDGVTAGSMCWSNIPAGVSSWTVTNRGQYAQQLGGYTSGCCGATWLIVQTASHTYQWDLDGYYGQYYLFRDGVRVSITNGYTSQLGAWHDLTLDVRNGLLSMISDGKVIATYTESSTSNNLTMVQMSPGWETVTNYDFVTINYVNPSQPSDFVMGASPVALTATAGSSGSSTINLASLSGFSGSVSLSAKVSPTAKGLSVSLSPSKVSLTSGSAGTSTVKISTTSSTPRGTYIITVTAIYGGISHSVTIYFTVS